MSKDSPSCPAPRPGLVDIAPYRGGTSKAPGRPGAYKLSANETPLGPSPKAVAAFVAASDSLALYPDGRATALRAAIAEVHGIEADRIVCGGDGSDQLLGLLAQAYAAAGEEVIYSEHGFLIYKLVAQANEAVPVSVPEKNLCADVDGILAAVNPRTKIVFLANPNNPTGSYLPEPELWRLRTGLPDSVLLVLDAAYAEYVTEADYEPGIKLVQAYDNVVMTRTFSKIYGLAALRLGWAYCPPAIADILNRIRGPFNVSTPAMLAGAAAMRDIDFTEAAAAHNKCWRGWLAQEISALGFKVMPSAGNFVLIQFPGGADQAAEADQFLLDKGLILRRVAAYGLPDCLRLSVGSEAANTAVVAALKQFVEGAG